MATSMNNSDKARLKDLAKAEGDAGVLPRVLLGIINKIENLQIMAACILAAVLVAIIITMFF